MKKKLLIVLISTGLLLSLLILLLFIPKNIPQKPVPTSKITQTSSSSPQPTLTQNKPSNLPLSLSLNVATKDGGKITGSLSVTNTSDQTITDLYSNTALYTTSSTTSTINIANTPTQMVVHSIGSPLTFTETPLQQIPPHSTKTVSFELPYSTHLKNDTYRVLGFVMTNLGTKLTSASTDITLNGTGDYLEVAQGGCNVIVDNKTYDQFVAPPVAPNSQAQGKCSLTNTTAQTLTVTYNTEYAVMNVMGYPSSDKLRQSSSDSITFKPNETKDVLFNLPAVSTPQVYEAWVTLNDSQSQPQSLPLLFRWTVKGASGRIEGIFIDKDYYSLGDTALVNVHADPPMDLYWSNNKNAPSGSNGTTLQDPKLSVSLSDKNGTICGQKTITLPRPTSQFSWPQQQLKISITKDCVNPKTEAKILDGSQVIVDSSSQTITSGKTLPGTNKPSEVSKLIIIPTILLIVIILIFIFYSKRGRGPKIVSLMLILVGILITTTQFVKPVLAQYKTTSNTGSSYGSGGLTQEEYQGGSDPYGCGFLWVNDAGSYSVTSSVSGTTANINISAPITYGFCSNQPAGWLAYLNGGAVGLSTSYSGSTYGDTHTGYPYLPIFSASVQLTPAPASATLDFVLYKSGDGGYSDTLSGQWFDPAILNTWNGCSAAPGYPYEGEVIIQFPRACTSPDPSTVCQGTYTDNYGNSCTGTKVCDTIPHTATLTNFASQCYQPSTLPTSVTGVASDNTAVTSAWYTIQRNPVGGGLCLDNADNKFDTSCSNVTASNSTARVQLRTFNSTPISYSAGPISSTWFPSPQPSPNNDKYLIKFYAQDAAANIGHDAGTSFTVDDACLAPFLQTTQGDVHSNTQINTPGGP